MLLKFYGHGYPWISEYPADLDLEQHPCPWILSWAGQSEIGGFGHGFGIVISIQTRSIAIVSWFQYNTLKLKISSTIHPISADGVHREYIYPTSSGTIQLNISGFNNYR
jgi:hypothetical protein